MYIIFLYQIVINAIFRILNENIFMRSIRQIDVKKIRIPDKKYFLDPCPAPLTSIIQIDVKKIRISDKKYFLDPCLCVSFNLIVSYLWTGVQKIFFVWYPDFSNINLSYRMRKYIFI